MNTLSLGSLALLTLSRPAEAARHLLAWNPRREVLWLAFFLAVVLNGLVQISIDTLVPVPDGVAVSEPDPVVMVLVRSAGAMMLSIAAFLFVGRFLGGTGRFEGIMLLTIWLQFLQIAAMVITLVLSMTFPALMVLLVLATALLSLYITLHFLNEAHEFGSLWKSFGVILLSALVAVPFVLMMTPSGPV